MSPAIIEQKRKLQIALNWINIIESCDVKIDAGNHAQYFKSVRDDAIKEYTELMASIVEDSIQADSKAETKNIFDDIKDTINKIVTDYNKSIYNIH